MALQQHQETHFIFQVVTDDTDAEKKKAFHLFEDR